MNRTSVMRLACLLAAVLTACAGGVEPPALSGSPVPASPEPLYPAPVSAETLEAYRALLEGEPGALNRPPEGLELYQVTLPPAKELEYVLLDLDGDGGAELVVQRVGQPALFNAVFHYGDGELSCWQYDTGTGPTRYSHLYNLFRYLSDGETEETANLTIHEDTSDGGVETLTYLLDNEEVDQDTFEVRFEELVESQLLSPEEWIPAEELLD